MTWVSPSPHDISLRTEYGNGNPEQDAASVYKSIDFPARLDQFVRTQEKHREFAKSKPPPILNSPSGPGPGTGTHSDTGLSSSSSFNQVWTCAICCVFLTVQNTLGHLEFHSYLFIYRISQNSHLNSLLV
jgi:hypothetical protein